MPVYERGPVRIHYEEMGSGFPLLVIPGGGLNSTIAGLDTSHPEDDRPDSVTAPLEPGDLVKQLRNRRASAIIGRRRGGPTPWGGEARR